MCSTKRTIVLDYDDTIVKSSELVIKLLNEKNNTSKTIEDLKDWEYKSIDKSLTREDVLKIYESEDFWSNIRFYRNKEALNFLSKYKNDFEFIVCSIGTEINLFKKQFECVKLELLTDAKIKFSPILIQSPTSRPDKSSIDLSDSYMMIDDNAHALMNSNAKTKILIKNFLDVPWNQVPPNQDNFYSVNSFKEIEQMIDFDLSR